MGWWRWNEHAISIWSNWIGKNVYGLGNGEARCREAHGWQSVWQMGCTYVHFRDCRKQYVRYVKQMPPRRHLLFSTD